MQNKVLELVKDLGYTITSTTPAYIYGVKGVRVVAESEGLTIRADVSPIALDVMIRSDAYGINVAVFRFEKGELPDLRFGKYSPELLRLARRFASVAGFEI